MDEIYSGSCSGRPPSERPNSPSTLSTTTATLSSETQRDQEEGARLVEAGQAAGLAVPRERQRGQAARGEHGQGIDGDVSGTVSEREAERLISEKRDGQGEQNDCRDGENEIEPANGEPVAPLAQPIHLAMIGVPAAASLMPFPRPLLMAEGLLRAR